MSSDQLTLAMNAVCRGWKYYSVFQSLCHKSWNYRSYHEPISIHRILVWNIYLQLVEFYRKCRQIYQSHGSYGVLHGSCQPKGVEITLLSTTQGLQIHLGLTGFLDLFQLVIFCGFLPMDLSPLNSPPFKGEDFRWWYLPIIDRDFLWLCQFSGGYVSSVEGILLIATLTCQLSSDHFALVCCVVFQASHMQIPGLQFLS